MVQIIGRLLLFSLLFVVAARIGFAQAGFETEQSKLNTEDAGPVGPGEFELEFAYGFLTGNRHFDRSGSQQKRGRVREHEFDLGLAMGVVDRVELNAGLGYADLFDQENESDSHGQGWTDLEIGSKILLFEAPEPEFAVTYAPSFTIPSGREPTEYRYGPGANHASFTQRIVLSRNWGQWNVNMDSGYELPFGGGREGYRGAWDTNAAVGYQLTAWLQPEIEAHYIHEFADGIGDTDTFAMTAGVIMPLHKHFRLDAGAMQIFAGRDIPQTVTVSIVFTVYLP